MAETIRSRRRRGAKDANTPQAASGLLYFVHCSAWRSDFPVPVLLDDQHVPEAPYAIFTFRRRMGRQIRR